MSKRLDLPPYIIDAGKVDRFDERQTVFGRLSWDEQASFYRQNYRKNVPQIIAQDLPGYSHIDFARILAAWTVHNCFGGAFSGERLGQADSSMTSLGKYPVSDTALSSRQVKETARMYGAQLVGICEVDARWVYSHDRRGEPIDIPPEYRYSIVMGIEMDREAVQTSPAFLSATATGVAYSRMAFTIACLAQFIRNLGYNALPMGNNVALSIPLAIDAGLGQMGRNGLLITPEYGPYVRLCKVFTDLPLQSDQPINFAVTEYCKRCGKCVEACKAQAIDTDTEPSFKVTCPSNSEGILRWPVNAERCYSFWIENGAACSNCIAACFFRGRN